MSHNSGGVGVLCGCGTKTGIWCCGSGCSPNVIAGNCAGGCGSRSGGSSGGSTPKITDVLICAKCGAYVP